MSQGGVANAVTMVFKMVFPHSALSSDVQFHVNETNVAIVKRVNVALRVPECG